MQANPFVAHIDSLPERIPDLVKALESTSQELFDHPDYRNVRSIHLVGCGDSFHACHSADFFVKQLTGIPCWSSTAMTFSRYSSGVLPGELGQTLVVGVSASGMVSRTIEALDLANKAGAMTMAITSQENSPLAKTADAVFPVPKFDSFEGFTGVVLPGAQSYLASLLCLSFLAIRLSTNNASLTRAEQTKLLGYLGNLSVPLQKTIQHSKNAVKQAASDWKLANHFVFCGSGPNYGTALFSAAKMIESSGVAATGQDLEEWAHIEYFGREKSIPTIIITACDRDYDRALEIAIAANSIGREVALIAPVRAGSDEISGYGRHFAVAEPVREGLSTLLTPIPAMLLAAYHAEEIGETYFRGFGGGRSMEGGGGISRIQTSNRLHDLRP